MVNEQYDNETVERYWQSVSTGYGGLAYESDSAYLEEIGKFLAKDSVLLDIGCGEGHFLLSQICQTKGATVVQPKQIFAIDNSSSALERFRQQLDEISKPADFPDVQLLKGDMKDIGKLDMPMVDMVLSRFALHHLLSVEEIKSCLGQVKRILKPHGRLVCLVTAYDCLDSATTFRTLPRGNEVPVNLPGDVKLTIHGYSLSEFIYAFHAAGFIVKNMVAMDSYKSIIHDKYLDGEPFPKEKFTNLTFVISCAM